MMWRATSGRLLRQAETEILRDLALRAKWGDNKRGAAMRPKDDTTADKLMARRLLYICPSNMSKLTIETLQKTPHLDPERKHN
jgi:hypothetical protein